MKTCSRCSIEKPSNEFYPDKGHKDGLTSWCKNCNKHRTMKQRYGITPEQYDHMLIGQDHRCAICRRHISELPNPLKVDHDHACCPGIYTCGNCIRGLLCQACNSSLGSLEDDVDRLKAAIVYLEAYKDRAPYSVAL